MTNTVPSQRSQAKKAKRQPKPKGYRQIMAEVHTWFGLLLGWLLFTIFIMGTVSYFNDEITAWMHPEISSVSQSTSNSSTSLFTLDKQDSTTAFTHTVNYLQQHYPTAKSWYIKKDARHSYLDLYIKTATDDINLQFNPTTQTAYIARASEGGDFFYHMHFDLRYIPYIWARLIVGFAAMMMLIAIITGIIVHKKIFTDFFTFRWGKGQRSWLDAHNGLSVLPLPFHIMITFTGIITLISLYMPWGLHLSKIDEDKLSDQLYSYRSADATEWQPAPLVDIAPLITQTKADWQQRNPNYDISRIRINHPNTDQSVIILDGEAKQQLSTLRIFRIYNGMTGQLMQQSDPPPLAVTTQAVMIGLHAGRYSDDWLRWLYFCLGGSGCGMIASGLILWTVKRRRQLPNPDKPYFGFWLVEKLNITALVGLPLAMVGYLWLNRLLPVQMSARADWEVHGFFIIWGFGFLLALITPSHDAWHRGLALVAGLLLLTPIMNAITTDQGLLHSIRQYDVLFISFDAMFVVLGLLFAYMAYRVSLKQRITAQVKPKSSQYKHRQRQPRGENNV